MAGEQLPEPSLLGGLRDHLEIARLRQNLPSALFDEGTPAWRIQRDTVIVFTGDWHLGAPGADYARFEQDIQHLSACRKILGDQLRIVAMGDFIDGYLPSGTPKNPFQILSPSEQRDAAEYALKLIEPDLIIEGDHDLWHTSTQLEHSWLFKLSQDIPRAKYVQWGGQVDLVSELCPTIPLIARHRYGGSRSAHPTGPHKKMHDQLGPARIVAMAHYHSNTGCTWVPATRRGEAPFMAVQSGTYKRLDEYGKKLGAYVGEYGVPGVLVTPTGTLTGYADYSTALSMLD